MKPFFTTIENQLRGDGTFGLLYDHYDDDAAAYAKLYTILAAAAVSELPYHSGHVIRSDGQIVGGEVFDRRENKTAFYTSNDGLLIKGCVFDRRIDSELEPDVILEEGE